MSGAQKKAKTGPSSLSEMEESHAAHLGHLQAIRSHLSDGSVPGVPADCAAARAVLRGIAEEASRSSREHRLRTKFERERIRRPGHWVHVQSGHTHLGKRHPALRQAFRGDVVRV